MPVNDGKYRDTINIVLRHVWSPETPCDHRVNDLQTTVNTGKWYFKSIDAYFLILNVYSTHTMAREKLDFFCIDIQKYIQVFSSLFTPFWVLIQCKTTLQLLCFVLKKMAENIGFIISKSWCNFEYLH